MSILLDNAFASAELVRHEVSVTDKEGVEQKVAVWVKPLSYQSTVQDITTVGSSAEEAVARRIAYSIMDDSGKALFTPEDIMGTASEDRGPLSPELTMELLRVIGETSQAGKKKA